MNPQFIVKLHKDHSKSDLIEKYKITYRYIAVNNPDFSKLVPSIYPIPETNF